MKLEPVHEKMIYRVMNAAVLACIGLFALGPVFGIGMVSRSHILVLCGMLSLLVGINFLPARGKLLCLFVTISCLIVILAIAGLELSVAFLKDYPGWCMGYGAKQAEWINLYRLMQTAVIVIAAYFVQILLEKWNALKVGLACVGMVSLLLCMFTKRTVSHLGVIFIILYIIVVYLEWQQKHWKKMHSGSLKAQIIWSAPFLVIYLLLMAGMATPEKPYDWLWAKNLYAGLEESFLAVTHNIFRWGGYDFDTALSGFSEEGRLGGAFWRNDRKVMHIQGTGVSGTHIYLIGKVYDTFDGRQWLQEYHEKEEERFIDTVETLYAIRRLDDEYLHDYVKKATLTIFYDAFDIGYLFTPLKTSSIVSPESAFSYFFDGGDMILDAQRVQGTTYRVRYYQLNSGTELFDQLLASYTPQDEMVWDVVVRQYADEYEGDMDPEMTLEMLEEHKQKVHDSYLDEIAISEAVESYLARITADANTDVEKLRAIEKELASFTYTKKPGELPDDVTNASEFLDYFLLESRQGYCVHFATAFVLLARAEGIPARYTQGFCVPAGEEGEAEILSSMAHSWPEVYIDGVGWIPFEPTPGYGGRRYNSWKLSTRPSSILNDQREEESEDMLSDKEAQQEALQEESEETEEETTKEANRERIRRILALWVPAVLAGILLAIFLDDLLKYYRYQRMSDVEKFRVEVRKNLRILTWAGLQREEEETLQELRERGMQIHGLPSLNFLEHYEDVVYGGKVVSDEMLEGVKRERKVIINALKEKKKLLYLYCRMRRL